MQNKGIVIFTAVMLTLASIFYLSFSGATRYYDAQAAKLDDPIAQQDYKDSVKYLGIYSYQKCLETQIGLGLDLKGGMNVILEISVPDVVDNLADHKTDAAYTKSMKEARTEEETSQSDFITLFIKAYHKNAPGHHLAEIFATQQLQGKVSPQSSDSEVEKVLRSEVQLAIDNSFNVVRNRIDKFGVVQPNIQKLEGQAGRIMVEMPGVKEPERMRKLLQGSANLEFWETYNSDEIVPYLIQIDQHLANNGADTTAVKEKKAAADKAAAKAAADKPKFQLKDNDAKKPAKLNDEAQVEALKKQHPLTAMLQTTGNGQLSLVGFASVRDTAAIDKIIYSAAAKQILPSDVKLLWSATPTDMYGEQVKNVFELHAIKVTSTSGRAPLEGDVVTDASDEFNHMTGAPEVSMKMNPEGARRWAALTKANVGKAIAIVLDNAVYSAPRVNSEIDGGQSSISGNFTVEMTKDLANTLKSGRMPAPARIVQEEVVGPTLGAQSIQQGIISFVIAFVLLIVYMVMMYNLIPGMIANCALVINVFFTLGILTSFQAALTMSGIAGMVLSLGTAVDANVLIYERIKEELRAGKMMKEAIKAGYSNAFSAIFDSNLTTIITGIILYYFGTGPIRGFATTLIIGVLVSFFTAVFLTRVWYTWKMENDKWQDLTFKTALGNRISFKNPQYKFMSNYKKSFCVFGTIAVICLVAVFGRGFSKSIDFTGGRNFVVTFDKQVQPEDVRGLLSEAFPESNTSAIAIGTDGQTIRISTNYRIDEDGVEVDSELEEKLFHTLQDAGLLASDLELETFINRDVRDGGSIISSQKVGPSVAEDITKGAMWAVTYAFIAIFLYILFRFRNWAFSVGAIVALITDIIVILGAYAILWGFVPFSLEIDQTFIGAILTAIGYSINDKVVVFDRIRENITLYPKRDRQRLFNDSLNATLNRTINTSVSTFIVLAVIFVIGLAFKGAGSIISFSFAMILGVIFGTFSSMFVAAPVAYLVMGRKIEETEEQK